MLAAPLISSVLPSLLALACSRSEPAPQAPLVPPVGFSLAWSGNVDGEIEPCG